MNAFIPIFIFCIIIIVVCMYIFGRKLYNNGNPIDSLRDNNLKSKDINRQTSSSIDRITAKIDDAVKLNGELKTGIDKAQELIRDIEADNDTASDIFKDIRNQKLD